MTKKYLLFTTPTCYNCPPVKEHMKTVELEGEAVDASTPEGLEKARELGVSAVPTVVFLEDDKEFARARSVEEVQKILD